MIYWLNAEEISATFSKYGDIYYALLWESSTMGEEYLLIDQYHTEPYPGGAPNQN